ncbi:MAG: 2-oxoglutarate dehydrogenase, E2 component, dihydrolipoamide succinyltransferase [Actinomycetaceae bacterium]|nr:2-oxoglutarate dehydrogenase, E2 component, dihydrolipoamide succinyltransferase [Actinomycetaceae bacterium]
MAEAVKMPALGESVTEGTVTSWLKQVGDTVEVDEPIVEVSTDKVDSEVPSPVAGVITKILVEEDETVEVGTELCLIGDAGEADEAPADEPAQEEAEPAQEEAPAQEPAPAQSDAGDAEGTEVKMPALGESVTEGTVTSWLKEVGDEIEADEPLLEVSTDKVDSEVPAPCGGYLTKILVEEDETVEVGTVVAIISSSKGGGSAQPAAKEEPKEEPKAEKPAPAKPAAAPAAASAGGSYVTPLVRKLAKDKGVDLDSITGTGIGGRIQKEDVLAAAERAEAEKAAAAAPAPAPSAPAAPAKAAPAVEVDTTLRGKTEKMTRLRQTIAKRMMSSLQEAAQLTTVVEVDVTRVAALRARAKSTFAEREGTKLTFLPFFVKAATEALKAHPKLNAAINGKEVTYFDHEHIGIAVDTPRGLLVPVIKNAGDLTISGIAKAINDLAARTRDGSIGADQLSGSTFTITNTGSGGALFDTPVLNSPEVGILGVGTIVKRPMVVKDAEGNETIGIRSMVYLALSYDHQLVDGADAARYLMTVKKRLEEGEFEAELGL